MPKVFGLLGEEVRQLGVAQQRLGRDAADVEADAAPVLLLDDRDLLAELRGADRGDVPTRAGTEDDDVVALSHGVTLSGRRKPAAGSRRSATGRPLPRGGSRDYWP